jgi:TPR repeat protein
MKPIFALLVILTAGPLQAQLQLGIDDDTERIVLRYAHNEFNQHWYVKALVPDKSGDAPLMAGVKCEHFGSEQMAKARQIPGGMDIYVARYNLVKLWMQDICHGKSDVLPSPEEAKAWLIDMTGLRRASDDAPFLDSRAMLINMYLFGAPGVPPDYAAGLAYLNKEVKAKPGYALDLFYVYEHGLGVPPDQAKAREWFQHAYDLGGLGPRILVAQAKELGLGVDRDEAAALAAYQEFAKTIDPPVWFRLGRMYLEGRGTPKNPCKAKEFFTKALQRVWDPVQQAQKYLDQIRQQNLCPAEPLPLPPKSN